jgi:hypothetical protein
MPEERQPILTCGTCPLYDSEDEWCGNHYTKENLTETWDHQSKPEDSCNYCLTTTTLKPFLRKHLANQRDIDADLF